MNGRSVNTAIFANFFHFGPPPMGLFFKLQQHIIPQKITFSMKIYDYENENTVQIEKI